MFSAMVHSSAHVGNDFGTFSFRDICVIIECDPGGVWGRALYGLGLNGGGTRILSSKRPRSANKQRLTLRSLLQGHS